MVEELRAIAEVVIAAAAAFTAISSYRNSRKIAAVAVEVGEVKQQTNGLLERAETQATLDRIKAADAAAIVAAAAQTAATLVATTAAVAAGQPPGPPPTPAAAKE